MSFEYGKNLEKFSELIPIKQAAILADDFDAFMEGLKESLDESKVGRDQVEKNYKKISELWLKKDGNKYLLSDDARNKIWGNLEPQRANEFLKRIANGLFDERYKEMNWADKSKVGIKEINIDDSDHNLKWSGNKLGIADKNGKIKAWVDLENLPRWANKIEYKDGKFTYGFFTGFSNKDVSFNAGTIGSGGEVIGPDGKLIGVHMKENIQEIKFENGAFTVKYLGKNKNGEDETKTIVFNDANMPGAFAMLKKMLLDPKQNEDAQKLINLINKPIGQQVVNDLSGAKLDLFQKLDVEYKLNVMFGKGFGKKEIIDLNFQNNGKLIASVSDGGTLVTMDSDNNVLVGYNQFYSSGGLVNRAYNSGGEDEKAEFIFNKDGTVEAAKNGAIKVSQLGTAYTSRTDYTQIDIFRNPYIDLILRGDKTGAINSILSMGNSYLDEASIQKTIDNLVNGELKFDKVQLRQQAIDTIKNGLLDRSLSVDLKRVLNKALNSVTTNLELSGNNLVDSILAGPGDRKISDGENPAVDDVKFKLQTVAGAAISEVLNNPENINKIISGDKAQQEKVRNDILMAALSTLNLEDYVNNPLTKPFRDALDALGLTPAQMNMNNEQLRTEIIKLIDKSLKEADSGTSAKDRLKAGLDGYSFLTPEMKDKLAKVFEQIQSDINAKINFETKAFEERAKKEIMDAPKYENRIVMDLRNREVYITGDKYAMFNAQSPLNKFVANSNGDSENPIVLMDNGNVVAVFNGQNTKTSRIVSAQNYYSIGSIVNVNSPSNTLRLDNQGFGGYTLYDPSQTVNYGQGIAGTITIPIFRGIQYSFPMVNFYMENPMGTDIGKDPNALVEFQNVAGMDKGRIFNWIMRRQLKKKFGEAAVPLSQGTPIIQSGVDNGFSRLVEAAGGFQQMQSYLQYGDQVMDYINQNNLQVPRGDEAKDAYSIVRGLQQDGNGRTYQPDVNKLISFLSQQKMYQGSKIIVTNSYIQVNGNRFSDANPALFRTIMRGFYYGRGYIPDNVPIKK